MFDNSALSKRGDCFFLPYSHPWGWATWQRAWSKFDLDREPVRQELLNSPSFRRSFDAFGIFPLTDLLKLAQKGLVDSWYIQWHRTIIEAGGVCLFPSRSYTENSGVSGGGTHASRWNLYGMFKTKFKSLSGGELLMPAKVEIEFLAIDQMRFGREIFLLKVTSFAGAIKRRLKRRLGFV